MVEIQVDSAGFGRAMRALESFPTREFMTGMADLTIRQALVRFDTKRDPDGQPWAPWSAGYRRSGAPFHSRHTLLHLSGDMMDAIQAGPISDSSATVEVPVPYAAHQNEARQFLGFTDDDPEAVDFAINYLVRQVEEAA